MRFAILFLTLFPSLLLADDPTPAPIPAIIPATIVAPKEATGTGKRDDPYLFTSQTKCVLRLTATEPAEWDLEDAPPSTEAIGNVLVFSLADQGSFQVISKGPVYARVWFVIKSGTDPPEPVDQINRRVRAALSGQPQDAIKFAAVCDAMESALPTFRKLGDMETAMKAALAANGWLPGRYPDLSKLSGELFGAGVSDRVLTDTDRAGFAKGFRDISTACKAVK